MRDRLIENEVKIWLPKNQDNIKIETDSGEKKTNVTIATITGLTTSWSVAKKIKQFLVKVNGIALKKPNDIVSVKIPNKDIQLKLYYGKNLYYDYSNVFSSALYHADMRCSSVVAIKSAELEKLFPNRTILVLMDCFNLLDLIQSGGNLVDGELTGKYMVCDYGTRSRGFRINFEPYVSDLPGVRIGRVLQSGNFVKNNNLIPGRLYSFTRRTTSDYFVYLGRIGKNILVTRTWYLNKSYEPYNLIERGKIGFPYNDIIQPKSLPSELHCFILIPNYKIMEIINSNGKVLTRCASTGDLLAISKNTNLLLIENLKGIELMKTAVVPSNFDLCDESLALIAQKFTNNINLAADNIEGLGQVLSLFPDVIWDTPELKNEFIYNSAKMCVDHWDPPKRLDRLVDIYKVHEIIGKHVTEEDLRVTYEMLLNKTI